MKISLVIVWLVFAFGFGCAHGGPAEDPPASGAAGDPPRAAIANPASTSCVERGGELEILDAEGGPDRRLRFRGRQPL